jgi:hypothetical protein
MKDFKRPWRWRKRARLQLAEHPLCAICLQSGKIEAAQVCDHVIPHRGDVNLFWTGELRSVCWSCHSSIKQSLEQSLEKGKDGKVVIAIGLDGYPIEYTLDDYAANKPLKS